MIIYPTIDLYAGKAVRLYQGDYAQMTVYSDNPEEVARAFREAGADHLHLVDLEGAKKGVPANQNVIRRLIAAFGGFVEVGGGIRNLETAASFLSAGVQRVILGTAAVTDQAFLEQALERYGSKIAVGVDLKDGFVAIRGWTEQSGVTAEAFFARMERLGVTTVICTDISRDGAMGGANLELYRRLTEAFGIELVASGGVSSLADVRALAAMGIHGTIVGKAYYTGAIDLRRAIEVAK